MITHAVIFAPLGQATRSEQVVERLSNAIVTGLLEANEQLPNESDLSKLMGVSHITIREALNTLRARGLIQTIRGRNGGSFVCDVPKNKKLDEHPLRSISSDYLADLGELHSAVMTHSAKLATQRSTEQELSKFKEFIDTFAQAERSEIKAQADMRCLLTIAAHAQSARLANHELAIQAEWASLVAMLYTSAHIHQQVVAYYLSIHQAMLQGDAENAANQASSMITMLTDCLIDQKFKLDNV
ncbi:MAG: GntR family transcriptional regulator [Acinetobacter sp.]